MARQPDLFGAEETRVLTGQDKFRWARAGEFLVACELILLGVDVSIAAEGRPYDLIADIAGKLIRIQIKTAGAPRTNSNWKALHYRFSLAHGSHKAETLSRAYSSGDADVFALVAMDIRRVVFITVKSTRGSTVANILPCKFAKEGLAEASLSACLIAMGHQPPLCLPTTGLGLAGPS